MQVIAFGECNHERVCVDCMLQMVMVNSTTNGDVEHLMVAFANGNTLCPMCKQGLEKVIISASTRLARNVQD